LVGVPAKPVQQRSAAVYTRDDDDDQVEVMRERARFGYLP